MEPLHDQPIESFSGSHLPFFKGNGLISIILGILILCSLAFNVFICIAYYPTLREDVFITLHKDNFDRLLFESGVSILEGVIQSESGDVIFVQLPEGNVQFHKSEVKRIEHDFRRKNVT